MMKRRLRGDQTPEEVGSGVGDRHHARSTLISGHTPSQESKHGQGQTGALFNNESQISLV